MNVALVGSVFAATDCAVSNLREKDDEWNVAAAGCAAGVAMGLKGTPLS